MKRLLLITLLAFCARAEKAASAVVVEQPFEPPSWEFFRRDDKFARPQEIAAPRFLFPFEFRRGGGAVVPAEVIVLVQLDGRGSAKQLKVLACDREPFARSAIDALKKAKWDSAAEVWFYYRHVYTLEE